MCVILTHNIKELSVQNLNSMVTFLLSINQFVSNVNQHYRLDKTSNTLYKRLIGCLH